MTYGRAHLTRRVAVTPQTTEERFVLNAGGLRLIPVLASGEPASPNIDDWVMTARALDAVPERRWVRIGAVAEGIPAS